jgi:hypothetical protein
MGFAIVAYRTQQRGQADQHVCKLDMRSLTLLSATLSKVSGQHRSMSEAYSLQDAWMARHNKPSSSKATPRSMSGHNPVAQKRKAAMYDSSDDEIETRTRLAGLRLIEGSSS